MKAASKKPSAKFAKDASSFQKKDAAFFSQQSTPAPFFGNSFSTVQPKLTVGKANDQYEKEADSTAEKVVQHLNAPGQTIPTDSKVQTKSLASGISPLVQQKCDECDERDRQEKKEDDPVQRQPVFDNGPLAGDKNIQRECADCKTGEENLQRKEGSPGEGTVSPSVENKLSSSKGTGSPLPAGVNQSMSNAFGSDFSGVRVHTGSDAVQMSRQLNAQAFTHGNDIYFNSGKYDTSSKEGQQLLAHELTHTVQQGAVSPSTGALAVQREPDNANAGQNQTPVSNIPGPPYSKDGYVLSNDKGVQSLTVPKVSLPAFKKRNEAMFGKDIAFMAGRIETNQVSQWKEAVKDDVAKTTDTFLQGKGKSLKSNVYFFKSPNSPFVIFGKAEKLKRDFQIPEWDRQGQPRSHAVDHIVELQLGGKENATNYELLDSIANSAIGSVIQKEIYRRIKDGIKFFKDNNVPNVPTFREVTRKDNPTTLVFFHQVDKWDLKPSKGDPDAYWSIAEVKSGKPLEQLKEMNFDEVQKLEGSDKKLHLFVKPGEGVPHVIEMPAKKQPNWLPGVDLLTVNLTNPNAADDAPMGTVSFALQPEVAKKINAPAYISIPFTKIPGLINAGALVFAGVTEKLSGLFSFAGLSPISLTSFDLNDNGLLIAGTITADNPLIKDASIDFSIAGNELRISKTFSLGELKGLPNFFKVTDVSLTVFASTEFGFGVEGDIDFEIGQVGKGTLTGIGATSEGFGVKGDFAFNSKKFKGSKVWFRYLKKEWSGGGTIAVTEITGVEKGQLTIEYKGKEFTAQGEATLKVPGIEKAKLKAVFDAGGGMDISGGVELKKLPGVKGGLVTVHVSKTADKQDYSLSLTGEVEPDLPKVPNLSTKMVVSYDNGFFKAEAIAKFNKPNSIITGADLTVGITNGEVVDGVLSSTTGGTKLSFYGKGVLALHPFKGVDAELTVKLDTKGEAKFSAKIDVTAKPFPEIAPKPISILDVKQSIPLAGVPFLTINAEIKLAAELYAKWSPLTLTITGNITDKTYEEITTGKFDADLKLAAETSGAVGIKITVGVGGSATLAVLVGGATIDGSLSLEASGSLIGKLEAGWSPTDGVRPKKGSAEANLSLDLIPSLSTTLFVDLDLIFKRSRIWSYEKGLAKGEKINLYMMSIKAPFEFNADGTLKDFDLSKIEFNPPLDKKKAKEQGDKASNPGKENPTATAKDTIKDNIRQEIRKALREGTKDQCLDVYAYANDLRNKYARDADPEIREFVIRVVDAELKQKELDEFYQLKTEVLTSKEPASVKHSKIDFFKSTHLLIDPQLIIDLHNEVNLQSSKDSVQKKPIFESETDDEGLVQKKTDTNTNEKEDDTPVGNIQQTEEKIQRTPQAGIVLPGTAKQQRYYKHHNEVVDILGKASFEPGAGLANYISSMWENGAEPAINIKLGSLGEGYIYLRPAEDYIALVCEENLLFTACWDVPPPTSAYGAAKQVVPITHPAFEKRDDGTLVYVVQITKGFIHGSLGWIPGKKAISIDPVLDAELAQTNEEAFLPLIYGKEYDGTNYVSNHFINETIGGGLYFDTIGILQLPNQQKIEGLFTVNGERYKFNANMVGKPVGLDTYQAPVIRTPDAVLTAEAPTLQLDANWTSGKADDEDGLFTASSQLRLSYKNRVLEIFGTAKYESARFNGEVNITVATKSQSDKLFAEHAAAIAKEKGISMVPGSADKENPEEPLALTAWGDLSFRLIDSDNKAMPGGKKSPIEDLEGSAAFVVSSDGFIILAGRLKLPTNWKLTPPLDYQTTDPENKDKHLFEYDQTIVKAWVPESIGTIEVKVGITVDVKAHLDPLELYEIEVSGVYSNHPMYRSEASLTPKFFLSGYAEASATVSAEGSHKLLGLVKTATFTGNITGKARIDAYIDAAPTVNKIWAGDDKAAVYGLSGVIKTGGALTFTLTGSFHLEAFGAKLLDSEDYHIGSWTLRQFAVELKMSEYILGSGEKPNIDYGKMGLSAYERHWLGQSITNEIKDKGGPKRTGGFEQEEDGKKKDTATAFSDTTPPPRPDHGKDPVDDRVEENFLMGNTLHDLVIIISGTRESPNAVLKMASGVEKPLVEKIEDEKKIVELEKVVTFDPVEEKRLDTRLRDLQAMEGEAAVIEKNAKETAQQEEVKDPKVAGFDQMDDRISDYAQKNEREDMGTIFSPPGGTKTPSTPPGRATTPAPTPGTPSSTPGTSPAGTGPVDLKKLKVGDLLSVPYKKGRARATVLDITKDFVTILIKTKKSGTGDIKNMIPRSRFKDMLDDSEIIIWSELRIYLINNRPRYVKGLVETVWDNAIQTDGKVRDPNPPYEVLTWHRSQSRYAQWHMGHKPKFKYSKLVDRLVNEDITWDEFIEEYNNPDNYHPELPSKNMSHEFEEAEPEP